MPARLSRRWILPTVSLWALAIVWMLPTLGLFIQSFRVWSHTQLEGWWIALIRPWSGWTLDGYRGLLNATANNTFWEGMLNSVAIAVPATLVTAGIVVTGSYALRGLVAPHRRTWWLIAAVALMAFPPQMFLVPILQLFVRGAHVTIPWVDKVVTLAPASHLNGTTAAAWLTICAMSIPFGIFLVYHGMASVPDELLDAARADGADHFTVFVRIVLPQTAPTISAFLALQFLWSWNEFLVPATMIGFSGSELPATVRIASVAGGDGPVVAAGTFVHSAVSITVFLLLKRRLEDGFVQSTS